MARPEQPTLLRADFRGLPTLNIDDGTDNFALSSADFAGVQLGDLFDETGAIAPHVDELREGTAYVVRVRANGSGSDEASAPSPTLRRPTRRRQIQDCTYTQGCWKPHPEFWPVDNLTIGRVNHTQAQPLLSFDEPAAGNGLLSLAHQLIAAKRNVAQGATAPAGVNVAIAAADALIGSQVIPPIGSGFLSPGSTISLTTTLDNFNQGITGPGHCDTVDAQAESWGAIKAICRWDGVTRRPHP